VKQIILKKGNNKRYCVDCKSIVIMSMINLEGHCPICNKLLYTLNNKKKEDYGKE
jgi:hypothetical protein